MPDSEVAYRGQWDFEPTLLPGSSASFHTSTNVGDKATLLFNGACWRVLMSVGRVSPLSPWGLSGYGFDVQGLGEWCVSARRGGKHSTGACDHDGD